MTQNYTAPMLILLVVLGLAAVATSVWRISRGGTQALGGVLSLVAMGGMVVLVIYVALQFAQAGNVINSGSPSVLPQLSTTPIPWSTVPGFSTPSGPGIFSRP